MEAVQPPLFLRFINLLMNDAVFLLDEALSNMAQLRQMLQARYFQVRYSVHNDCVVSQNLFLQINERFIIKLLKLSIIGFFVWIVGKAENGTNYRRLNASSKLLTFSTLV